MKTKKLNFKDLKGSISRDEMKKIMAGSGTCAGLNQFCNTPVTNCCSGYVCASHKCQHPTL